MSTVISTSRPETEVERTDHSPVEDRFFFCCCRGGPKRIDRHLLLWGHPRGRFPLQGMVGPDWRVMASTLLTIPFGTTAWACLLLLGGPEEDMGIAPTVIVTVGVTLSIITIFLYLSTACSDPGIVFKATAPPVTGVTTHRPTPLGGRQSVFLVRHV
ncbi:unnamed protein product [Discosporangium mesarthrocarpum]